MEGIDMIAYFTAAWVGAALVLIIIQIAVNPLWAVNANDWHCTQYDFGVRSWDKGRFYADEYNTTYLIIPDKNDLAWKYCTTWEKNKECSKTC